MGREILLREMAKLAGSKLGGNLEADIVKTVPSAYVRKLKGLVTAVDEDSGGEAFLKSWNSMQSSNPLKRYFDFMKYPEDHPLKKQLEDAALSGAMARGGDAAERQKEIFELLHDKIEIPSSDLSRTRATIYRPIKDTSKVSYNILNYGGVRRPGQLNPVTERGYDVHDTLRGATSDTYIQNQVTALEQASGRDTAVAPIHAEGVELSNTEKTKAFTGGVNSETEVFEKPVTRIRSGIQSLISGKVPEDWEVVSDNGRSFVVSDGVRFYVVKRPAPVKERPVVRDAAGNVVKRPVPSQELHTVSTIDRAVAEDVIARDRNLASEQTYSSLPGYEDQDYFAAIENGTVNSHVFHPGELAEIPEVGSMFTMKKGNRKVTRRITGVVPLDPFNAPTSKDEDYRLASLAMRVPPDALFRGVKAHTVRDASGNLVSKPSYWIRWEVDGDTSPRPMYEQKEIVGDLINHPLEASPRPKNEQRSSMSSGVVAPRMPAALDREQFVGQTPHITTKEGPADVVQLATQREAEDEVYHQIDVKNPGKYPVVVPDSQINRGRAAPRPGAQEITYRLVPSREGFEEFLIRQERPDLVTQLRASKPIPASRSVDPADPLGLRGALGRPRKVSKTVPLEEGIKAPPISPTPGSEIEHYLHKYYQEGRAHRMVVERALTSALGPGFVRVPHAPPYPGRAGAQILAVHPRGVAITTQPFDWSADDSDVHAFFARMIGFDPKKVAPHYTGNLTLMSMDPAEAKALASAKRSKIPGAPSIPPELEVQSSKGGLPLVPSPGPGEAPYVAEQPVHEPAHELVPERFKHNLSNVWDERSKEAARQHIQAVINRSNVDRPKRGYTEDTGPASYPKEGAPPEWSKDDPRNFIARLLGLPDNSVTMGTGPQGHPDSRTIGSDQVWDVSRKPRRWWGRPRPNTELPKSLRKLLEREPSAHVGGLSSDISRPAAQERSVEELLQKPRVGGPTRFAPLLTLPLLLRELDKGREEDGKKAPADLRSLNDIPVMQGDMGGALLSNAAGILGRKGSQILKGLTESAATLESSPEAKFKALRAAQDAPRVRDRGKLFDLLKARVYNQLEPNNRWAGDLKPPTEALDPRLVGPTEMGGGGARADVWIEKAKPAMRRVDALGLRTELEDLLTLNSVMRINQTGDEHLLRLSEEIGSRSARGLSTADIMGKWAKLANAKNKGTLGPGGLTNDDAIRLKQSLYSRLDPQRIKTIEAGAQGLEDSNHAALEALMKEGIITPESMEIYSRRGLLYTPVSQTHGVFENGVLWMPRRELAKETKFARQGGRMSLRKEEAINNLEGPDEILYSESPIDASFAYQQQIAQEIARNKYARTIVSQKDWHPEAAQLIKPFTGKERLPRDMGTVSFFENGEVQTWTLPSDMADALEFAHTSDLGTGLKSLSMGRRLVQGLATSSNLAFMTRNIPRDFMDALMLTKGMSPLDLPEFAKLWGRNVLSILKDEMTPVRERFKMAGADYATITKNISPQDFFPKPSYGPLALTRRALNATEQATKEAAFELITKRGGKFQGRDLAAAAEVRKFAGSPDFGQWGSATKRASEFILFFNPQVQGIGRLAGRYKEQPERMLLHMAGITAMLGSLTAHNSQFINPDTGRPAVEDIPETERQANLIIFTPDQNTSRTGQTKYTYYRVPLGHAARLLWIPIQDAFRMHDGDPSVRADETAMDTLGTMLPGQLKYDPGAKVSSTLYSTISGLNPLIKVPIEQLSDTNAFTQAPIVGQRLEGLPLANQYSETTSPAMKLLGKSLDLSPARLEHVYRSLLPGPGEMALSGIDWLTGEERKGPKTPAEYAGSLPIVGPMGRSWTGTTSSQVRQDASNKLYRRAHELSDLKNLVNQSTPEERAELGRNPEVLAALSEYVDLEKRRRALGEIARMKERVRGEPNAEALMKGLWAQEMKILGVVNEAGARPPASSSAPR